MGGAAGARDGFEGAKEAIVHTFSENSLAFVESSSRHIEAMIVLTFQGRRFAPAISPEHSK
jgi:hypothetical protein